MKAFFTATAALVLAGVPASLLRAGDEIDPEISFRLGDAVATRGSEFRVPLLVSANASEAQIAAFVALIDFDEAVLEVIAVEQTWDTPPDEFGFTDPWCFFFGRFANTDEKPGNDLDEGAVIASGVFSCERRLGTPLGSETEVITFVVRVRDDAPIGETELRFDDDAFVAGTDPEAYNAASVWIGDEGFGSGLPDYTNAQILINARISVVGDVSLFRRGNANGDEIVNLTDAVMVLNYLFLGESPPVCFDAADANDDGIVDLSDPVATLSWLFLGVESLPPPGGDVSGPDPTPDHLGCELGTSDAL